MLKQVIIFVCFLVLQTHSYNDGYLNNPFRNFDAFDLFGAESRAAPETRDVEEVTERDREPLAPDYKDPDESKPHNIKPESGVLHRLPEIPHRSPVNGHHTPAFDPSILPGGVIDVSTDDDDDLGFSHFPNIHNSFGFSSSFGGDANGGFPDSLFGPSGIFGPFNALKPWWKGENVCIEREETTDNEESTTTDQSRKTDAIKVPNFFSTSVRLSNCQETANKYECITKINNHGVAKTFVVRYKCCYGFQRDSQGCSKKINLVPLLETIGNIKETEFKNLIQSVGLESKFTNENLTVFVPTNDALVLFTDSMNELNQIDLARRRRQTQNAVSSKQLILNHVIPGYNDLSEIENEDVLYSENNNNSIRFNIYPTKNLGKMMTANCAHVRKENNMATNGIVHIVDGVISPVTQSLLEIIAEHPQLSHLRQALQNTNLTKNFKPNGHYTIFAPTDAAFNKLEPSAKHRLVNGDSCAATILKHHIVAHTVCSPAIMGHATTHTVDGQLLNLQKTDDGDLLFEDKAKIVKRDIVGTNGVIHLIDTIVIPDAAFYITQSLKKENFTKFLSLIEESGLANEIDALKNVTVFAPSDAAFADPDSAKLLDEIKNDKEKIRDFVMYHTTEGELESCNMNNDMQIKTKTDKSLRLNLYSTFPIFSSVINRATVNCARLTGYDEKSCGSMIHEVSKVLSPPTKTIMDLINSDDSYKILRKLLNATETEKLLNDDSQSITFLAPTDDVIEGEDKEDLDHLLKNKEKADKLFKNHILTEVLCCSGIGPHTWGFDTFTTSLANERHAISRTGSHIRVGRATVTECDNVATNGVIQTVNSLLYPNKPRNPAHGFIFFSL